MAGTGTRALKLQLLADVSNLTKNLDTGSKEVEGFGGKLSKFGKVAGAAFAAAGVAAAAYAGKLLVDGVKSAIEDEAAQARLATTLGNVTGATNSQIKAVEDQILKTSLLTGVSDDELRPSFERLVRSTKDSEEALKLQQLALDIAAGSGKSLEAVSNALGKGIDGSTGALGKLGIGLSAAELKTMTMDEVTAKLAETFGGQATEKADTFAGKMDRLKVAFNEGKETVGAFVLDAITPMVSFFVDKVIPIIQQLAEQLGPKLTPIFEALAGYIREYFIPAFEAIWTFITEYLIPTVEAYLTPIIDGLRKAFEKVAGKIAENEEKLKPLFEVFKAVAKFVRDTYAPLIGGVLGTAFNVLGTAVGIIIDLFANLVSVINSAFQAMKNIVNFVKNNPVTQAIGGAISGVFGGGRAAGGVVNSGTSYLVGERGAEIFTPNQTGSIIPNHKIGGGGNTVINLNVTGAIDPEGTARSIISVLNNSYYRGTSGAAALVS